MSDEFRIHFQGDPNDTRFQFEIIKGLAESVRAMGETQTRMLERLARIEEQRVHEAVSSLTLRVNHLEQDADQRTGALKQRTAFLSYWGPITWTIGIVFTVLFLLLRATGILQLPDKPLATVTREVGAIERRESGNVH